MPAENAALKFMFRQISAKNSKLHRWLETPLEWNLAALSDGMFHRTWMSHAITPHISTLATIMKMSVLRPLQRSERGSVGFGVGGGGSDMRQSAGALPAIRSTELCSDFAHNRTIETNIVQAATWPSPYAGFRLSIINFRLPE